MTKKPAHVQEKGVISTNQFIWMLFIIITSVTAIQVPFLLIKMVGRDAWISVIGGWLLDVLLAIIYAYLGIRFQGQNFVQYSMTILGKYLGRIIGIIFPLFFLLVSVLLMRGLAQLLNIVFFPKTPLEVIKISGYLVVAYGVHKGIEVMGRMTELLGPIYILSSILIGFLVAPQVNFGQLRPQLENGPLPIIQGSFFVLTFYGICIMMGMFIPLSKRPENGFLAKFSSVSMGAFFVMIIVVLSIAVFGFVQAKNINAPGLELTRMISVGRFLERVEVIWMIITIGSGIMASAILIWSFCLGISQIVGLSTYKPLINPSVLIAFFLCLFSFKSNMEQLYFVEKIYPVIALIVEGGLIILLFLLALILKKRAKSS